LPFFLPKTTFHERLYTQGNVVNEYGVGVGILLKLDQISRLRCEAATSGKSTSVKNNPK
jgi:hypothetical protein